VPGRQLRAAVLAHGVAALALCAGKDWLLAADAGVFWVLMRVLALAGVGALVWSAATGQLKQAKRSSVEVRV
jgi:solute carrier family 30 (zinc transporter), member 5/7